VSTFGPDGLVIINLFHHLYNNWQPREQVLSIWPFSSDFNVQHAARHATEEIVTNRKFVSGASTQL